MKTLIDLESGGPNKWEPRHRMVEKSRWRRLTGCGLALVAIAAVGAPMAATSKEASNDRWAANMPRVAKYLAAYGNACRITEAYYNRDGTLAFEAVVSPRIPHDAWLGYGDEYDELGLDVEFTRAPSTLQAGDVQREESSVPVASDTKDGAVQPDGAIILTGKVPRDLAEAGRRVSVTREQIVAYEITGLLATDKWGKAVAKVACGQLRPDGKDVEITNYED